MSITVKSVHLVRCDEPKCLTTLEADSHLAARKRAAEAGWFKYGPAERVRHVCPKCKGRYVS
jgi:hypothetical protein